MYTDFPNHNFTKQTKRALASLAVDVWSQNIFDREYHWCPGCLALAMASGTITTTVPPWVKIFASLNPAEVEIIEMTNPIVTGMASVDQPIQERLHESVYLLRNGLTPDMVKYLEGIVGETFPAIAATSSLKATRAGNRGYHSWQAVRYQDCTCKYEYAGNARHKLYQYAPMDQYVVDEHKQPKVVSQLLEALWSKKKGILATQEEKFQHVSSLCPMNALIVNRYEDGDTIPPHSDHVQMSSEGQKNS